jgi:hypothetical protein
MEKLKKKVITTLSDIKLEFDQTKKSLNKSLDHRDEQPSARKIEIPVVNLEKE